ncbi:hypothetical protein PIB30_073900 [Stylosanthes scabra]|uniref:Uncharacterized protein n=1 Tax=Stylosanthes scabra TaxID=79078 RepID=A0ABU6RQE3_9FABA|nr:hypothetical protein [Stylosanthes scabra]
MPRELTRSVIIANPTGPVHVPNHYRTHFPEDDTLIALNVYVLISIFNMGVSSFLIWYAGTLALLTPMARTTPVVRYCHKPGRQPAGPHLSLQLTLCHHGDILIVHKTLSKTKTYPQNRFRRGRIDSKAVLNIKFKIRH